MTRSCTVSSDVKIQTANNALLLLAVFFVKYKIGLSVSVSVSVSTAMGYACTHVWFLLFNIEE